MSNGEKDARKRGRRRAVGTKDRQFSFREEANAVVCLAFRNGFIEQLHAGAPSDLLEKPGVRRVTDQEMERMMSAGAARIADLLRMKESDPERYWRFIEFYNQPAGYVARWDKDEPVMRRQPEVPGDTPFPASPEVEARGIAAYTFGQSYIMDLMEGEDTDLLQRKGLSRITQAEMALIMIGTSARMAELLWLRTHDRARYAYVLSLIGPCRR